MISYTINYRYKLYLTQEFQSDIKAFSHAGDFCSMLEEMFLMVKQASSSNISE